MVNSIVDLYKPVLCTNNFQLYYCCSCKVITEIKHKNKWDTELSELSMATAYTVIILTSTLEASLSISRPVSSKKS